MNKKLDLSFKKRIELEGEFVKQDYINDKIIELLETKEQKQKRKNKIFFSELMGHMFGLLYGTLLFFGCYLVFLGMLGFSEIGTIILSFAISSPIYSLISKVIYKYYMGE